MRPCPELEWVEVGSRPPETPEDSGHVFPDGQARAMHNQWRNVRTMDTVLTATEDTINSWPLDRVLCECRISVSLMYHVRNACCA